MRVWALLLCLTILTSSAVLAQPSLWVSRGPGGGGALYTPTLSPHQPAEFFLTCDMSGTYRTPDFGVTWRPLDFSEIRGATQGCQVQFTSDPAVLYAIDYAFEEPAPAKSLDGGDTWDRLPSDPTGGGAYTILADLSRTDRVLVSGYGTLYFSADGGVTWNARYSDSGGLHLAGAFFDGDSIYVGSSAGLLVSSNGGSSFGLASVGGIPADEAMVSFSGAKEGGTIRLLCVTLGSGDVYPGITGAEHGSYRGVYTLDWGQPNWVQRTSGIVSGDHPFFCGMSGGEADVLYVAGGSDDGVPVVYRSLNSGVAWTKVLLTANNQNVATGWSGAGGDRDWSYGEYALGFAVSPVDPGRAVFTDLGFAHGTSDGGATWRQLYVHPSTENPLGASTPKRHYYRGVGLENTSCWWLTWSDASGIFASFTDIRGVRSMDGGVSWGFDYSGHTLNTMYHCVRHPNGTLYAATSSVHDLYQSTYLQDSRIDGGSGRVLYSTDGGATWQLLHDFAEPVVFLALDPNNPNRLYASVVHGLSADGKPRGGVWVSSNIQNGVASTWTKLADPPRTEGHPYTLCVLNDGSVVCSYSGRRNSSGTFTASSGVFILPSGATSWTDRSANPGMHYWTKDLVIDPHDASQNTWFACVFSGWGGAPNGLGGVYRTANRGQSWTRISALDRVESLVVNPASAAEAYVTTEIEGLWHTSSLTAGSPTFTRVESYLFQHPLRVFFNPHAADELWVTSFGYGMALGLIGAQRSPEVSGTTHPLRASRNGAGADVLFEESGADHYNLYVSNSPHTHPFRVASPQQGKRACDLQALTQAGGGYLRLTGYDLSAGISGNTEVLFFLVSADDGAGTEGPLGTDSLRQEITADLQCAR